MGVGFSSSFDPDTIGYMKRIGLLGGISHESTIMYYALLMQKYFEKKHDYYYPEVVIFSLDFQKFTDFERSGDTHGYVEYILSGIRSLEYAGVDFIAMTANSPHAVFPTVSAQARVPMISIVETVATEAQKNGVKRSLLLGIKFTMQSSFYPDVFTKRGMEIIVPQGSDQNEIDQIIFQELVIGAIRPESKKRVLEIIESYDTDTVILGCTEIPLLIGIDDTEKKVLNPLALHVKAILDFSLNEGV